jgi:transposase
MKAEYSQDFKNEAVALALSSDLPYAQIAKDLGVHYQTFGNWMRKPMPEENTPIAKPNKKDYQFLEKELRAAHKELKLRKKEIEFLKKAYFAALNR